jgi:hypothetical protein
VQFVYFQGSALRRVPQWSFEMSRLGDTYSRIESIWSQYRLPTMGIERSRACVEPWQFWRRLVGTALICALIIQPLLLAIIGAQLANASAIDNLSLSELCQHATDGNPLSPAERHKHGDDHCAFCFAAGFHLQDAPRPVTIQPFRSEAGKLGQSAYPLHLSFSSRYSVARSRGPPLNA